MVILEDAVLRLELDRRLDIIRITVDDDLENIEKLRIHLRKEFPEVEKLEVVHVDGRRIWRGKMCGMKPEDRVRLRAMAKARKVY